MTSRSQVDIWALSDLCTLWCVHVVATLRRPRRDQKDQKDEKD
jgi:hypothetical protein